MLVGVDSHDDRMVDFAVRTGDEFAALELNEPSFAQWVTSIVGDVDFRRSPFVIRGGGNAGRSIARHLLDSMNVEKVTIVERDRTVARRLAELLPQVSVVSDLTAVSIVEAPSLGVVRCGRLRSARFGYYNRRQGSS